MKKILLSLGIAAASTLALTNCAKESALEIGSSNEFSLIAGITKTANNGLSTDWVKNDGLSVFYEEVGNEGNLSDNIKFSISEDDLAAKRFVATTEVSLDEQADGYNWYAIYPYNKNITTPANKTTTGYITVGGKSQTQKGNDSMAHLCGTPCPLYGEVKNVPVGTTPTMTMKQVSSVLEFVVKNTTAKDVRITKVEFTATNDVTGSYFIDFTADPTAFVASGDGYVYKTATLSVMDGDTLSTNEAGKFYLAIKPFTTKDSLVVKVTAEDSKNNTGVVTKVITPADSISFTAGHIKTVNVDFNQEIVEVTDPEVSGEYKYTFNCSYEEQNHPIKAAGKVDLGGLVWLVASDSEYYGADATKGQQFGSSSKSATAVSMTAKTYTDTVNAIYVESSGASSAIVTLKVSVGGVYYTCADKDAVTLTTTSTEYCFIPSGEAQKGVIAVEWSQPESKKGFYVKGISINPTISLTSVTTGEITALTDTSATLNGSYEGVYLSGATITAGFTVDSNDYSATVNTTTKKFSYDATGLTVGHEYTAKAWVSIDGGTTKTYGSEVKFTPKVAAQTTSQSFVYATLYSSVTASSQAVSSDTVGPISIEYKKLSGSNDPKYYKNGTNLRMYNSSKMTFTSTAGKITKIEFTASGWDASKVTSDSGAFTTKTWNGGASTVVATFTATFKIEKIVVTYEVE